MPEKRRFQLAKDRQRPLFIDPPVPSVYSLSGNVHPQYSEGIATRLESRRHRLLEHTEHNPTALTSYEGVEGTFGWEGREEGGVWRYGQMADRTASRFIRTDFDPLVPYNHRSKAINDIFAHFGTGNPKWGN